MAAIKKNFASRHYAITQNLKNHFPKRVFDEIWHKLADYQKKNIWIKIAKMFLWSDFIGKTNSTVRPQYANLC